MNLVVQTAFPGDLILSVALLKGVRQRHKADFLGLVCRRGLGELFLRLQLVDYVFEIEHGVLSFESAKLSAISLTVLRRLVV